MRVEMDGRLGWMGNGGSSRASSRTVRVMAMGWRETEHGGGTRAVGLRHFFLKGLHSRRGRRRHRAVEGA